MKKSPKQKEASRRAWLILRLRGAHALFKEIDFQEGMDAVNKLLARMGAKKCA